MTARESKVSIVKDVLVPLCTSLTAAATVAIAAFLWNLNASLATVVLTQSFQAKELAQVQAAIETLRNEVTINKLEVVRVESQCSMWVSEAKRLAIPAQTKTANP